MSTHSHEHEELLAALAAGERSPTEPEAEGRLRECAQCAREWNEVQDMQRRIEDLARSEEIALDELRREGAAPGEERVLPTLMRLAAAEPHARRRRRPLVAWLTAAALLLAGGWLVFRFLGERPASVPPVTLGRGLEIQRPKGPVTSYAPFVWTDSGGEADSYALRIYDRKDTAHEHPLVDRARLEGSTWTPSSQELDSLPAQIYWELEARDAHGAVLPGSTSAEASRLP